MTKQATGALTQRKGTGKKYEDESMPTDSGVAEGNFRGGEDAGEWPRHSCDIMQDYKAFF